MVDRSDLERIGRLYQELRTLDAALGNFDAGGLIVSMTISGPPLTPPPMDEGGFAPMRMAVTVNVAGLMYPPQMVENIKEQFRARIAAIGQELTTLGVTGASA